MRNLCADIRIPSLAGQLSFAMFEEFRWAATCVRKICGCRQAPDGCCELAWILFKGTSPPSGYIDIEYDGMSTSGVYWKLENRATQALYMKGTGDKIWPNMPVTKCRTFDYLHEGSDPPYLADGSPSIIKVSPGGRSV
jgi:hypothetical protein